MTAAADGPVSRGEFAMLARTVEDNARRLEVIDSGGTRGVGALSVQITEVIKDVAGLQQDLQRHDQRHDQETTDHQKRHDQEMADRAASRRWMIGTLIALFLAMEGPLAWIATHVH